MEYKRFGDTYAVRLDRGEEILEKIKEFAQAEHIAFASVRALGAVGSFTCLLYTSHHHQTYARAHVLHRKGRAGI